MNPKISVIMPAYNAGKYISTAIDSVLQQNAVGLTGEELLELLVVDDGSTDDTVNIVEKFCYRDTRVHLFRNPRNQGVTWSRNYAVTRATGEYVAFLDSDDWWEAGKLERQLALIQAKQCVLVYTGRELMDEEGNSLHRNIRVPEEVDYRQLLRGNIIPCSSVLLQSEIARKHPFTRDELHEDYILWLTLLREYGTACGIGDPLLKSRMSSGGKSRDKFKSAAMTYWVYRHMGFNPLQSLYYFAAYAVQGVKKYHG